MTWSTPLDGSGQGQTLTDAVYETIIGDISEGMWSVGARLPTEAALV